MNSFLDSNVIIGYIFCLDSLFEVSREFIFKSENNYFSDNVKMEVEKVFIRKCDVFNRFLFDLFYEIEKYDDFKFLTMQELYYPINYLTNVEKLKIEDMHIIFDKIWKSFDFGESQEVFLIKLKFKKFINDFEGNHRLRKGIIFNNMKLVPNHSKKDKVVLDKIKNEHLRKALLHESDENILFDANEFACRNPNLDLKFVSADEDFLKAIDILMQYLCIDETINLKEFSNN